MLNIKFMMPFYNLTEDENDLLLLLPVYISLRAVKNREDFDKNELETAVRFAHTQTFCCDPLLITFYREVDKDFESILKREYSQLTKDKAA